MRSNSILRRTFWYFLISMCVMILVFAFFFVGYLNRQYLDQLSSAQIYVTQQTAETVQELLLNIRQSAYYLCCNETLAKALIDDQSYNRTTRRMMIQEALVINTATPTTPLLNSAYVTLLVDKQFHYSLRMDTSFALDSLSNLRIYSAANVYEADWYLKTEACEAQVYAFCAPEAADRVYFSHLLRNIYVADPRYSDHVGVVLYSMPQSTLQNLLRNDQMTQGSISLLLYNDLLLCATDDTFLIPGTTLIEDEFPLSRLPANGEMARITLGNTDYMVTSCAAGGSMRVIVLAPQADMAAYMSSILPMLGSFLLALAGISLILAFMFSRQLTVPILNLSNAMVNARKAQALPQPIPVPKVDSEIEYLYQSYNDIVESIHRIAEAEREQNAKLRQTELKALQSQINPHFVYNTLDSVVCIALMHGEEDIATISASLINILKYSIGFTSMQVFLQEEIKYLQQYIQIQSLRYRERFTFVCDIPDAYAHVRVCKLLIQPLVENALFHAENQQQKLQIRVWCEQTDGCFFIHVSDNGTGADAGRMNEMLRVEEPDAMYGIGIRNVNKRIQLMAGREYGIRYEQLADGGLDAIIVLPFELKE